MPVTIKFNPSTTTFKITNTFNSNLGLLCSEILNDCNEYCKMDTGMLIASSYIHSKLDQGLIIWQTPYARRQYWEIRTAYTDNRSKAQWKWAHAAKRDNLAKWNAQAQRLMEMSK